MSNDEQFGLKELVICCALLIIAGILFSHWVVAENYELLTKQGNPVWKVTYGHMLHDGAFDYEDTNRDGRLDWVEKGYHTDYRIYVLVKDAAEQEAQNIGMILQAREYVRVHPDSPIAEVLASPTVIQQENGQILLFYKFTDGHYLKSKTFVVRGTVLAQKLEREFELAKKQPEDPELANQ